MICYFKGHDWYHIANFRDITGGRGLWQCTRCKILKMDATSEFYDKYKSKKPHPRG